MVHTVVGACLSQACLTPGTLATSSKSTLYLYFDAIEEVNEALQCEKY